VRLGRRGDARRGPARLRGAVRLHHPQGLRPVGDLARRVVQPSRPRAQGRLDRHADRRGRDEGEVAAFVALEPGQAAELQAFVKEQVAAYKYPRRVFVVDELPKGPTGKILKRDYPVFPPDRAADEALGALA
jgi:acyl-CoA synthetase (AMP-forming)/AMP-acid ligase II